MAHSSNAASGDSAPVRRQRGSGRAFNDENIVDVFLLLNVEGLLDYTLSCNGRGCQAIRCPHLMARIATHIKSCQLFGQRHCLLCSILFDLLCCHMAFCRVDDCRVPPCKTNKRLYRDQESFRDRIRTVRTYRRAILPRRKARGL